MATGASWKRPFGPFQLKDVGLTEYMVARIRACRTLLALMVAIGVPSLNGAGAVAQPTWQPFRWLAADVGSTRLERAALAIPVNIRGLPGDHCFQLDLGATVSYLHGGSVEDLDSRFEIRSNGMTVSGTVGGVVVEDEPVEVLRGFRATFVKGQRMLVVGTLGLSFFERRTLVLDYPGRRFMLLPADAVLPGDLASRVTFIRAVHRNGKLYVPIEVAGVAEEGIFFDSGASSFSLVTSPQEWRRLTGRRGDESSNRRMTVSSWDTDITMVGAPMTGALRVGPVVRRRPVIWFTPDSRFSFDNWPSTTGMFGNELFADQFIVVVDVPHGRVGVAASDTAQPNKRLHPTAAARR